MLRVPETPCSSGQWPVPGFWVISLKVAARQAGIPEAQAALLNLRISGGFSELKASSNLAFRGLGSGISVSGFSFWGLQVGVCRTSKMNVRNPPPSRP